MSKETNEEIISILCDTIGDASMCWRETPLGVFDSERASDLVDETAEQIKKVYRKELLEELLERIEDECGVKATPQGLVNLAHVKDIAKSMVIGEG